MKIKITGLPKAKTGGFFNMPFAGVLSTNPFGLIQTDTKNLDKTYNDSIKAIDKDKANLEAEKGEVLFKFDAGGLFKVLGKKHSKGGTPIKADPGDFIFSNDKSLSISEKEAEVFRLKRSSKKHLNTPATILKKEVDPKMYNKFISVLNDPKSDVIAKTTAQIMLSKYLEKIGQIGYLQESKKDFPQGLPEFSMGTAPVYSNEIIDAEDKSSMFKKGGSYLPKAQMGWGIPYFMNPINQESYKSPRQRSVNKSPNRQSSNVSENSRNEKLKSAAALLSGDYNYSGNINIGQIQDFLSKEFPDIVSDYMTVVPNTNKGRRLFGKDSEGKNLNPQQRIEAFRDQLFDYRLPIPQDVFFDNQSDIDNYISQKNLVPIRSGNNTYYRPKNIDLNNRSPLYYENLRLSNSNNPTQTDRQFSESDYAPVDRNEQDVTSGITRKEKIQKKDPKQFNNIPTIPFQGFNIGMNSQEVLSGIMPFLTAASMPTYYDMLSQKYTPPIRLDRVSPNAEIDSAQQASALATREMFSNLDSSTAALASSDVRAREAQAIAQAVARANQINIGQGNLEDSTNFQTQYQDNAFNVEQIHRTYNNNVLARQRRNEMLANATNQSIGNFLAIQNNLDALNQQATASVIPFLSNVDTVDANGNPIRVQVPPVTFGRNRIPIPTGYGSLDSAGVRNLANVPGGDDYLKMIQSIMGLGISPDNAGKVAATIIYGRSGRAGQTGVQAHDWQSALANVYANMYKVSGR